jgi:hypothetical protein
MAKQIVTETHYTDDLDGSTAVGTIQFGFEGIDYEIDLSRANTKAFEKAMALYVGHARKVRSTRGRSKATRSSGRDLAAIRAWASSNGYEVSERGRIAGAVIEAYDAAH